MNVQQQIEAVMAESENMDRAKATRIVAESVPLHSIPFGDRFTFVGHAESEYIHVRGDGMYPHIRECFGKQKTFNGYIGDRVIHVTD